MYTTSEYAGIITNLILMRKVNKTLYTRTTKPGKYIFQPVMMMSISGYLKKSCLFNIQDSCHGYEFLVNTGAKISVISRTTKNNLTQVLYKLQAANGTKINTYGGKSHALNFGI